MCTLLQAKNGAEQREQKGRSCNHKLGYVSRIIPPPYIFQLNRPFMTIIYWKEICIAWLLTLHVLLKALLSQSKILFFRINARKPNHLLSSFCLLCLMNTRQKSTLRK